MIVSFDSLRPDMVLGVDVLDGGGRLLLPAGTVLTEKHLRYCQMWGIAALEVEGDEAVPVPEEEIDPELLARVEEELRPDFRHTDLEHLFVATLFRHCAQARARQQRGAW